MRNRVLFMLRGGEVVRFHTLRTLQTETVGYHSFGVAWFCHFLAPAGRKELILAALAHDLAEQSVGDTPAPTKRELGISKSMGELEDRILHASDFGFELDEEEQRVLKLADCFQGMLFCIRERSLGNRGTDIVCYRYRSYVVERLGTVGSPGHKMLDVLDQLWKEACNGEL